ncbi:MAG: hypothetical protein GWN73_01705, partial [Actinobacteria bacterium]|nr:hypothetical protein [Actinomycetota bacterium]NIT94138.1 hypothetical protein [Actinomycetota bacterium]NIU64214.1 hypothetical protein [Actinomycetota bacterium]NIV54261.1 hypothetical protein [Actinomycetota bacterium]NIW26016.1 hypothetical protein [Actinomycetota bacterium]
MRTAAWEPDAATVAAANVTAMAAERGLDDYASLWRWSVEDRAGFWS